MNHKELKNLLILLIIASGLLFLLNVFRFYNSDIMPVYDSYEHINNINQKNLVYPIDNFFSKSENYLFLFRLFPFLASIINVSLLFFIGKKVIRKKKNTLFLTLLIFLLSPPFLFIHGTYNSLFIPLIFILFGLLFVLDQKYFLAVFSFLLSFGLNQNLIPALILLLIVLIEKLKSRSIGLPLLGMIIVSYLFSSFNNVSVNRIFDYNLLQNYIFDLGSLFGFGIFTLILTGIGFIISWNNKKNNYIIYVLVISLFLFSLFNDVMIFFIDVLFVYYAGLGLSTIIKKKWDSELLKNYVIILLICGLIFSSGSFIKELSETGPRKNEIQSLEWLKTQEKGRVLSHYKYGHMISGISGFDTYIDKTYYISSKNKIRISNAENFFYSRDLEKNIEFLNRNNIKYIWINKEMRSGQVWNKDDEGVLLIMKNSHFFKRIYDFDAVQIWEYMADE